MTRRFPIGAARKSPNSGSWRNRSAALYHFAHAAYHDGQGALPDATRKPLQAYLEKTYINFHGDKDGLDALIEASKKEASRRPISISSPKTRNSPSRKKS